MSSNYENGKLNMVLQKVFPVVFNRTLSQMSRKALLSFNFSPSKLQGNYIKTRAHDAPLFIVTIPESLSPQTEMHMAPELFSLTIQILYFLIFFSCVNTFLKLNQSVMVFCTFVWNIESKCYD